MSCGKLPAIAVTASMLGLAVGLAACGSAQPNFQGQPVVANAPAVSGFGVVQSIDIVPTTSGGNLAGTAAGAVAGGLLGNQVGGGTGRTAATVAGMAGGAMAGHEIQGAMGSGEAYRFMVAMDNGGVQTIVQANQPGVQPGDRVRVQNGAIVERVTTR